MKKLCRENQTNRYIVPAFARGLKLMEFLARSPEGLSMSEMGGLGIPPATLFRMLTTLVNSGYAVLEKSGEYRLNGKLLSMAYRAVENTSLTTVADGPMRELRDRTGESVMLAVLHRSEGVVIHQVVSEQPVKVLLEIGHHFPLHTAAPAKAILAFLPDEKREALIQSIRFTPYTPATIRNEADFRKELCEVRKNGVAYDRGEELSDLRCVAAPIPDRRNQTVAAVWITGPASRLSPGKLKQFGGSVRETASQIAQKLN